ncbi:hypothetical protein ABT354_06075 [Streptomyces sp. NPDC000594]|uniref:hypothetical protein n=1 Tax=Streptomyces sp. NPDC000594 TaxID=3154261 RepID=UPI00331CB42B
MTDASDSMPAWERRFRAPRVSLPDWAEDAPDRSDGSCRYIRTSVQSCRAASALLTR